MGGRVDWRGFAALAAVTVCGYGALPGTAARRLAYHAVLLSCIAVVFAVQRRLPHPLPWRLLGLGLACFALHSLLEHQGVLAQEGVAALAIYLVGYALLVAASLRFVRVRAPGGDREGLIDGAIVATAVAVVLWEALTVPQLDSVTGLMDTVTLALFPLLQALLAAIAVRLLFLGTARLASAWLLVAAVLAALTANVAYVLVEQRGGYQPGSWLDLWWVCTYVLVALAILHPSSAELTRPVQVLARGLPFGRLLLLGLALTSAPALVVARSGVQAAFVASVLLTVLVLWRFLRLVAEREQAQVELLARAEQHRAVALLGLQALEGEDLSVLFDALAGALGETLRVDHVALWELEADGGALCWLAGTGWPAADRAAPVAAAHATHALAALAADAPVVVDDLASEKRFCGDGLAAQGMTSGAAVVVAGHGRPFGVLSVHTDRRRSFGQDDVAFLQSLANAAAGAVERRRAESEIRWQALHDPLTGLPNRTLLLDRLAEELAASPGRGRGPVSVLFVDLDHFKEVNDRWGHHAGDALLVGVTARLRSCLRLQDTLSRFAGDEFVLICPDADAQAAAAVADRLTAALALPLRVGGNDLRIGASIGIVVGARGDDPDSLLRQADAAMYQAKEGGRRRFELFDDELRALNDRRTAIERDLPGAAARGELRLAYQPLVTPEGAVRGVEALLRWRHPELGWVAPEESIPVAESGETITSLGAWVIVEACRQVASWHAQLPAGAPLAVFVNTSARQLTHPELADVVTGALAAGGCDPSWLCLEVTESALLSDDDSAVRALRALQALGVRVAIDDFGTGYSSLSRLKRLPIDVLKIDGSFIGGIDHDEDDHAIVAALTGLAHSMGMTVVAEGVETAEQLAAVRAAGCDLAQGNLLAHPLDPADVIAVLGRGVVQPPSTFRSTPSGFELLH
jgi:diguanylate cyclase (GGDEF)-like protein